MTELKLLEKPVTLPHDIKMFYVLTIWSFNGEDIEETYTCHDYEGARQNFAYFTHLGQPVELTCNVEVWKDEEHSETEYISIAKNF